MENQKLLQEEIQQLNQFQTQFDQIVYELGQVSIQSALLEGQRNTILEKLAQLQEDQNKVGKELQAKYGEGTFDLNLGEFIKAK